MIVRKDANLNMSPDKKKSSEKIDDMTALIMGIGLAMQDTSVNVDAWLDDMVIM